MIWESAAAAITAALTLVTRRFASRLVADDELPRETIDTTARPSNPRGTPATDTGRR